MCVNGHVRVRSCRSVSWLKLDLALPWRRTKVFFKLAFCRTRHKARLQNNNKSSPYAHFIKHNNNRAYGGGAGPALTQLRTNKVEIIMDDVLLSLTKDECIVHVSAVCVHMLADAVWLHCCTFIRFRATPSEVLVWNSFNSAAFLLMRDQRSASWQWLKFNRWSIL